MDAASFLWYTAEKRCFFMTKRIIPILLALGLLLSACSKTPQNVTEQSCSTILQVMLAGSGRDDVELYTTDPDVTDYADAYYGLTGIDLPDGAIARANGASAFELAVFMLSDDDIPAAVERLQNYLLQRQGDFTGYAPDQAAMVENALILSRTEHIALIIADDPPALQSAFESCFGEGSNAVGAPDAILPTPLNNGRTPFTDPGLDDMTIYDTSAILAAWETGDDSALSSKDAVTLRTAQRILEECLTEGMSDYEKEVALYRWICTNVNYDWTHQDPSVETPRESFEPLGALVNKTAVCLGYASGFQLLMDMAGVECITVTGAAFQSRENHAWNMVRLNGQWYCTDATWDIYGDEPEYWNYFNVTSDWMAESNHQWDYAAVPEATATDGGRA